MALRFVYAVIDADDRARYVGKTSQAVAVRFAQHLRAVDRDDARTRHLPLHRWLAKYRDEARVIELESGEWSVAELNAREVAWIAQYGLENLLNVARGGNGGWIETPGHREAINAARWIPRSAEQRRVSALKMLETRRQKLP